MSHATRLVTIVLGAGCLSLGTAPTTRNDAVMHVALVFDDGPAPSQSPAFLELFKERGLRVTFSFVGKTALEHPETARAVAAAGHEIVNHSFAHLHPRTLDDAALAHEIIGGQKAVAEAAGVQPHWYWPPFLERDPRQDALFAKAGIEPYVPHHLVSSNDWNAATSAEQIARNATIPVTDGTVILFHEWREDTLAQLPGILDQLKKRGAVFMTFSELAVYVKSLKAAVPKAAVETY